MFELYSFALEDFFREYEHLNDLVNLASSDAHPWMLREIIDRCPGLRQVMDRIDFKYPDVEGTLLPSLERFCRLPPGLNALPTSGTAEAIFLALAALRCRDREHLRIAIPWPSYGAFDGISHLLGYDVVRYRYRPDADWSLDADELLEKCTESDVVVINNPHNPTGHVIADDLFDKVSEVVRRKRGVLLVDEVFRLPEDCSSATRLGPHVIVFGGVSKVYGMPGLRLGWLIADETWLGQMRTLQQYATLSLSSLAVALGAIILDHIDHFSRRELLRRNRRIVEEWSSRHAEALRAIPSPAGTTAILEIRSSAREDELFHAFLDKRVLLVPGFRCFGGDYHGAWFRLGYGAAEDVLRKGLDAVAGTLGP